MLRGLGSVESVGSKRRQAAWTRQVATAGAVLRTSVDRSAVPRARALPQSSRCRLAPAPAPPGPDATFLFGTSSSVDRCEHTP